MAARAASSDSWLLTDICKRPPPLPSIDGKTELRVRGRLQLEREHSSSRNPSPAGSSADGGPASLAQRSQCLADPVRGGTRALVRGGVIRNRLGARCTVLGAGDRAVSKTDLVLKADLILSLWSLETDY